jgi:ADP-ribose pyrophosphatase YjhB (NUDIX family)
MVKKMTWDLCYVAALSPCGDNTFTSFLSSLELRTDLEIEDPIFVKEGESAMIPKILCSPSTSPIAKQLGVYDPLELLARVRDIFHSEGLLFSAVSGEEASSRVRDYRNELGLNVLTGQRVHVSVGGFAGPESQMIQAAGILSGEALLEYITTKYGVGQDGEIQRKSYLPVIGVGAVILDKLGRILLMDRTEETYPGWFIPVGNIKQDPIDTIKSELKEELGIDASIKGEIYRRLHHGGKFEEVVYLADIGEQYAMNIEPNMCRDIRYFSAEEIRPDMRREIYYLAKYASTL